MYEKEISDVILINIHNNCFGNNIVVRLCSLIGDIFDNRSAVSG
jgi:hypothetical protein